MPNTEPSTTSKVVHVSVAVIERLDAQSGKKQILIAKRPDHVHQGGLWEFPGGKVEKGETVLEALDRELFEELNIALCSLSGMDASYLQNRPLIQIKHHYPDKTVFLDVWCIQNFTGAAIGKEGQAICWVDVDRLDEYAFPAANAPILSACLLPNRYFITPQYTSVLDAEMGLDIALAQQADLIYLRQPHLDKKLYNRWVATLLLNNPALETKLLYQFSDTLKAHRGAGVHFSQHRLRGIKERPVDDTHWFAISCHDRAEVEQAIRLGADFITLSPVLPTRSHPGGKTLGWEGFSELLLESTLPAYALGGLSLDDETKVAESGAQGLAGISFWQPKA